jgi:hypothetical protein
MAMVHEGSSRLHRSGVRLKMGGAGHRVVCPSVRDGSLSIYHMHSSIAFTRYMHRCLSAHVSRVTSIRLS